MVCVNWVSVSFQHASAALVAAALLLPPCLAFHQLGISGFFFKWSSAVLSSRTFCDDRNLLYMCCPVRKPVVTGGCWTFEM